MRARRASRSLAIAAAGSALTATGCGTGASAGAHEQVRAAVDTLLSACAAASAPAIPRLLTAPAERAFVAAEDVRHGCDAVLNLVGATADPTLRAAFHDARVADVDVEGDIAVVSIVAPEGRRSTVEAEHTRGEWRVTNWPLP